MPPPISAPVQEGGFNNDAFMGKPMMAKKTVKKMAFEDSDDD